MAGSLRSLAAFAILDAAAACTTLVVGRDASVNGDVLVSHSGDAHNNADGRLCRVPAKDFEDGSKRAVYKDKGNYPVYIGHDLGDCYLPKEGETPDEPIGYIPQVNHTYALWTSMYGMMNEVGLGMGESTCTSVFSAYAVGHGGSALLSIDELSRIALERTATARDAVKTMGALAEEYGFYGPDPDRGESLMVGDPLEAFIFHITADPSGKSAIWVAQRVPDDEVGVVANMFVIRDIDFGDAKNFLYSESTRTVAEEKGWWKPGEPLDFTMLYSTGEYTSKFYSGHRVWGAYRLFGLNFTDDYEDLRYNATYPVTAKPVKKVDVQDLFAVHRDHYEGTSHDLTKGLASGPWGDPDRIDTSPTSLKGEWERAIGIYRSVQSHVVQIRKHGVGSVLWFGPHSADATVYFPVPAVSTVVPEAYMLGNPKQLDRRSAFWAHRYVFNVAKMKYSYAMQEVHAMQLKWEGAGRELVQEFDRRYFHGEKKDAVETTYVDGEVDRLATLVLADMWSLPDLMVSKYADGWINDSEATGYPDWWLKAVGYMDGPPPPPSAQNLGYSEAPSALELCVQRCPSGSRFAACLTACQTTLV